jgi:hypothetical protein
LLTGIVSVTRSQGFLVQTSFDFQLSFLVRLEVDTRRALEQIRAAILTGKGTWRMPGKTVPYAFVSLPRDVVRTQTNARITVAGFFKEPLKGFLFRFG